MLFQICEGSTDRLFCCDIVLTKGQGKYFIQASFFYSFQMNPKNMLKLYDFYIFNSMRQITKHLEILIVNQLLPSVMTAQQELSQCPLVEMIITTCQHILLILAGKITALIFRSTGTFYVQPTLMKTTHSGKGRQLVVPLYISQKVSIVYSK